MALTDAMLLSDAIERHDTLKEALEQYTAIRKDPLRFYQWVSLIANPWFQSSRIPLMAFARDNFFASGTRLKSSIAAFCPDDADLHLQRVLCRN
jgi:2-polyprenyl-6-methoxyphenol hydroxylase-like FAD-dependent oxidoreductase